MPIVIHALNDFTITIDCFDTTYDLGLIDFSLLG